MQLRLASGGEGRSHQGDGLLKQLQEEAQKASRQTLHARGERGGSPPEDQLRQGDPWCLQSEE